MKVFPGLVEPREEISEDLLEHLRYPEDLFKIQRELIAKYHVTDPQAWFSGQELWVIPEDPEARPPARRSRRSTSRCACRTRTRRRSH